MRLSSVIFYGSCELLWSFSILPASVVCFALESRGEQGDLIVDVGYALQVLDDAAVA